MKKLFLTFLSLFFVYAANAQDSTVLCKGVLQALKSGNIEALKKLVAPPEVYKAVYAEAKTFTDEQIKEKTSGSEKLKSDFESILTAAKQKKVDLKQLQYDSLEAENPWESYEGPWGISFYASIGEKTAHITISAFRHNNNWYFMEFLISAPFKEF
jgi:hypothetical protein